MGNSKILYKSYTLAEHSDSVNRVCFSKDGSLLASASSDKSIIIWNT